MGSLGPTHLIALLLAVAIVAATGGFVASAIARTNKRPTHRLFLLGCVCGLTAGAVLRGRRRSLHAWRALDGRHRSRGTSLLTGSALRRRRALCRLVERDVLCRPPLTGLISTANKGVASLRPFSGGAAGNRTRRRNPVDLLKC
jgi:hypothetical protein